MTIANLSPVYASGHLLEGAALFDIRQNGGRVTNAGQARSPTGRGHKGNARGFEFFGGVFERATNRTAAFTIKANGRPVQWLIAKRPEIWQAVSKAVRTKRRRSPLTDPAQADLCHGTGFQGMRTTPPKG